MGIICILLAASFGGNQYPWKSQVVILLFVGGGIILGLFILTEHRYAVQPIVPLKLFAIRNVLLCNLIAILSGFVLLAGIAYLPEYFQVVQGNTPTISGLKLLPVMVGLIIGSIGAGMAISKTGFYYPYPILGCLLLELGLSIVSYHQRHIIWMGWIL